MAKDDGNSVIFGERTTEITLEELKELDSFKNFSEQQAKNLIDTMKTFARIMYHIWLMEQKNSIDKPIQINIANPINKAA